MSVLHDALPSLAPLLSGQRCQQHVARLSQMHRIIGTPGYEEALGYVREQVARLGIGDAVVERFPMDGARAYGDWVAPVAWEPRAAGLWIDSPQQVRLCDFAETPICLHVGSRAQSPAPVVADLVDVGSGLTAADYSGKDVTGRIVLASGNVREVYEEAVQKRGARGVVSDNMPWQAPGFGRSPLDQPDLVSYNKLNIRHSDIGRDGFSFALSARQGATLRRLLQQGPVRLRATVDAKACAGEMGVLNVRLPGAVLPDQEWVLVTHLCHPQPGANDNATGPALVLELLRALCQMPPLRHTVRALFVPEAYGTVAWLLESRAPRGQMRLALNLDMVGGDTAQTRGHLWLDQTPWSTPTYANDLLAALLADVAAAAPDGWQYGVREHMGGSDHILFLAPEIAVPAVMLGHEPDRFYHSNQDTVDKTSPREFVKVGQTVLAALALVDHLTPARATRLAHGVYHGAARRLMEYGERTLQRVWDGAPGGDYVAAMQTLLAKEQAALRSIVPHADGEGRTVALAESDFLAARLADICATQLSLMARAIGPATPRPPTAREGWIPRKEFRGPISSHLMGMTRFFGALGDGAAFYRAHSQEDRLFVSWMFEAVNLMDGRRTLGQIQQVLAAEYGEAAADVAHLQRLADDLVSVGMASWVVQA